MDLFENILHTITWGIASLVDTIYRAFLYLSGITVIQNNQANQGQNIIGNDFLSSLLNAKFGAGGNITFNTIYLQFMVFGILILGITLIIATIKTFINKEDEVKSRNLVYQKAGSSLLAMVIAPFLFMVVVWGVSVIITTITNVMMTSMGQQDNSSIANLILGSCYSGTETNVNWIGFESYTTMKGEVGNIDNFSYWLALIGCGCTLVGFIMVSLTVVERIIHILFLYLISPFIMAKNPLDQGRSFEQWRDLMLSKFFSLAGIIVCIYLFYILQGILMSMEVENASKSVVILLFLIGGVFTFTKAGTLVAHLISQGSGNFEGMSQATSMGMLNSGLRIAGHAGLAASRGLVAGAGGTLSNVARGLRGVGSGAGANGGSKAGGMLGDGQAVKGATGKAEVGLGEATKQDAMQNMASSGAGGQGGGFGDAVSRMGVSGAFGYMAGKVLSKGAGSIARGVNKAMHSTPVIKAQNKLSSVAEKVGDKTHLHPVQRVEKAVSVHKGVKAKKQALRGEKRENALQEKAKRTEQRQHNNQVYSRAGSLNFVKKQREKDEKKEAKKNKKEE